MAIGLISDVHANIYGLKTAISAIREAGADSIFCAGDIVGYYPFINETINLLREEGVNCIIGNHDAILAGRLQAEKSLWNDYALDYASEHIEPDNLDWLRKLPSTMKLNVEGINIEMYHGSPWNPLEEYVYPDNDNFERFSSSTSDFLILGHTHWPLFKQVKKTTVVNPGSCGQPRDFKPGSCYALLETEDRKIEFYRAPYDLETLASILKTMNVDRKLIDILRRSK